MSFSQDIRASSDFIRQFNKQKRRIQASEFPNASNETLQTTINHIRTQGHFLDISNTFDNVSSIATGPHDYILEPDYSTVKIRSNFNDVGGIGNYQEQTIGATTYSALELYDQAATGAQMWYCIPVVDPADLVIDELWKWKTGFHPSALKLANSISLNEPGIASRQLIRFTNIGTDFDFTANDFSLSFWIYPTSVASSGTNKVVAYRNIDTSNEWGILIDTDAKIWVFMDDTGATTKRQYDTPLTANTWYHIALTWDESTQGLLLRVNDNADTTTTKVDTTAGSGENSFYFGSYPGAVTAENFNGYLTGLTYYKDTVLSTTEITRLFNRNTISDTTKPGQWGILQYG